MEVIEQQQKYFNQDFTGQLYSAMRTGMLKIVMLVNVWVT